MRGNRGCKSFGARASGAVAAATAAVKAELQQIKTDVIYNLNHPLDALQNTPMEGALVGGVVKLETAVAKELVAREALASKVLTESGELRLSASVADKYASARPYVTPLSVQETIVGGVRHSDPQGVAGRFMYTVDTIYNKSAGKFEVLVNEITNTVEHAVFKSNKL